MPSFEDQLAKAAEELAKNDPMLKPVIEVAGLCTIRPHQNYYQALVESIIGQQLSVIAAAAIKKRFVDLFGGNFPSPEQIIEKNVEDFRTIGFSRAKGNYAHDLAEHVIDGRLKFDEVDSKTNDEVVALLTDVKGIGEWTAHMFLMFCMGRLDVLPVGDLGIKNGIRRLYGFEDSLTPDQIKDLAKQKLWHPYESVASWYIWRSLDNEPAIS
jgi:DNA-3-methyladenine glycosylase II